MLLRSKPLLVTASLLAISLCSASAVTVTVGDTDPATGQAVVDGWDGTFVFHTSLTAPNANNTVGQVTQFEFYAHAGTTGRTLTPILFSSTDGGASHVAIGLGTTLTIGSGGTVADGVNTVAFGLTIGTDTFDTTTPGTSYYVGFHNTDSGGVDNFNGGVVSFTDNGLGGPQTIWRRESLPTVGSDPSTGSTASFSATRTYAYNFDINFVPEPSQLGLLALGSLALLVLGRSRR